METKLCVAMRAFIVYGGKILIIRESMQYESPNQGKYDVAGGKVNFGERFDEGLIREIEEETGLKVRLGKPFSVGEWRPIVRNVQFHIVGTFFECFATSNNVKLSKDHDKFIWVNPQDYQEYNLINSLIPAFKDYINR